MSLGKSSLLILRIIVAVTLLAHSLPQIYRNTLPEFGQFLDAWGLAPLGFALAWLVKLSHLAAAAAFLLNRYVTWAAVATIVVLIGGIIMVHRHEGWYVIGLGCNGMEYNFVLAAICIVLIIEDRKMQKVNPS